MIDLKGKKIFVITSPELGWDCVIGVYIANSRNDVIEFLGDEYNPDDDVISESSYKIIPNKSEERDEKINLILSDKQINNE
jgi:hypothetical protein